MIGPPSCALVALSGRSEVLLDGLPLMIFHMYGPHEWVALSLVVVVTSVKLQSPFM